MKEKVNASQYPKIYYVKHMINGLCAYDGDETVLITADTMKRMAKSMDGKPIYNGAHDERSIEERLEDIKTTPCGYVADTFFNELDSWLWSKVIIIDDEAHENIANGFKVSNAYVITEASSEAGTHNNIPYDREVFNGIFTHIAIVDNPRYEQADILTPEQFKVYQDGKRQQLQELRNSKPTKGNTIMKLFKNKKEEVSNASEADTVEYKNSAGELVTISVKEMVNSLEKADKAQKEEEKLNSMTVTVGGKQITVAEAVKAFEKLNAKKNEAEKAKEEEKENESEEEEEKENESEADDEDEKENESDDADDKEKGEKSNSKTDYAKELKNAHFKGGSKPIVLETTQAKLARGQALYGSSKQ